MGTTHSRAVAGQGASRRSVLLLVLPVLVLLAAFAPATATAGTSSDECAATVTADGDDAAVARFEVLCSDDNPIVTAEVVTSEPGSAEGGTDTTCTEADEDTFNCSPDDPDGSVTGTFTGDSENICASPRLTTDFTVDLEDGGSETLEDIATSGCSGSGGGGDSDDEDTPEGGVDSGFGAAAGPQVAGGIVLPLGIAAIVALASAGIVVRRTRATR